MATEDEAARSAEELLGEAEPWEAWETWFCSGSIIAGITCLIILGFIVNHYFL